MGGDISYALDAHPYEFASVGYPNPRLLGLQTVDVMADLWELQHDFADQAAKGISEGNGSNASILFVHGDQIGRAQERVQLGWQCPRGCSLDEVRQSAL